MGQIGGTLWGRGIMFMMVVMDDLKIKLRNQFLYNSITSNIPRNKFKPRRQKACTRPGVGRSEGISSTQRIFRALKIPCMVP